MLERLAAALKQSFPETRTPKVGAFVILKTGGVAKQWRVSNIKIATGTLVTIKFENSEMIVDASWFVFDANSGCLFLQRLGFFATWLSSVQQIHMKPGETSSILRR